MQPATTPLARLSAVIFWFVGINALAGAGFLMLFPQLADELFFWPISLPLNAALFGALYLGGGVTVCLLAAGGRWEPARFLTPVLVTAGPLITLVTLLHLESFRPGLRLWYWLIVYAGAPLLALGIYRYQEARPAIWRVEEPLTPPARRLALAVGGLILAGGLLLLAWPATAVAAWPWPTTPLMTRIFAAWFSAFGAGLLWFAVERDWRRLRPLANLLVAAALLDLAMLIVHRGAIPAASPALGVFIAHLLGLGLVGVLLHGLQAGGGRGSR